MGNACGKCCGKAKQRLSMGGGGGGNDDGNSPSQANNGGMDKTGGDGGES